jgi:hypothetical protein
MRGADVQVLQVQPRLAEERREGVKTHREADRRAVHVGDDRLGIWARAEHGVAQGLLGRHYLVGQPFVIGKLSDKPQQQRDILNGRRPDVSVVRHWVSFAVIAAGVRVS